MYISVVLFSFCLLSVFKWSNISIKENRSLTDLLKFIAALLVVNGHLFQFGGGPESWVKEMNLGPLMVSFFFFLSGYGLMCSYSKKGMAYMDHFISHRLLRVILPLVTAYIFSITVYAFVVGPVDWNELFVTLLWGGPYMRYSWYVSELVVLYLFFYFVMRTKWSLRMKSVLLSILVILLMVGLVVFKQPIWYIESLPAFLMGIWFQEYEESKGCALSKFKLLVCIIFLVGVFFVAFRWDLIAVLNPIFRPYRYEYLSFFVMNVAFISLLIIALKGIQLKVRRIPLIACFYEIYLLQNSVMMITKQGSDSFFSFWLETILLLLIVSVVFHYLNGVLVKILDK